MIDMVPVVSYSRIEVGGSKYQTLRQSAVSAMIIDVNEGGGGMQQSQQTETSARFRTKYGDSQGAFLQECVSKLEAKSVDEDNGGDGGGGGDATGASASSVVVVPSSTTRTWPTATTIMVMMVMVMTVVVSRRRRRRARRASPTLRHRRRGARLPTSPRKRPACRPPRPRLTP